MARLVFTTLGSSGDLFPLLPVARELARRGHDVSFAANPSFREDVTREGLPFAPIGVHLGPEEYAKRPEILDPRQGALKGIEVLLREFLLPHLPRVVEELRAAADGADLLLSHPAQLAAPIVAELCHVPWSTLSVFPGMIPSDYTVPQGSLAPARGGRVGRAMNRVAWRGALAVMRWKFDGPLNQMRTRFGLPPSRDIFTLGGLSPDQVLLLCPPQYCDRPPDWDARIVCSGYTLFDTPSGWQEPPGLDEFLGSGPPPVLVSLGTSVAVDPGEFLRAAGAALERAGQRGLFLVGRAENLPASGNERHAYFEYVPLSHVLSRCRLAVHPGGFGTSAAVVTAGIPSIVVPRAFDQAYHAERLQALGVGISIPWRRFSVARLARALEQLLGNPAFFSCARSFAAALGPDLGVKRASDAIEQRLASL